MNARRIVTLNQFYQIEGNFSYKETIYRGKKGMRVKMSNSKILE